MKNFIWPVVILIIAIGAFAELRYELNISSPIVSKMDRLTGDVWIANAGAWRKVQLPAPENGKQMNTGTVETKAKAK